MAYLSILDGVRAGILLGSRIADRLDANFERKTTVTSLRSRGSGSG